MNKNILLCGVGGQGTVLASKLLSAAALDHGWNVRSAETIGMAQRGGSVTSHMRMGDDLYSPLIGRGQADLILAFEPGEAVRSLPFLNKTGAVVVSSRPVRPVMGTLEGTEYTGAEMIDYLKKKVGHLTVVDADDAARELGSSRALNVVLLGAALMSGVLDLTADDIRRAVREKVAPQYLDMNLAALDYGMNAAR